MLLGDDVVDRVNRPRDRLRDQAIFTTLPSPFADHPAQRSGNVCLAHGSSSARLTLGGPRLCQTDEMLDVLVPFPLPSFLGRESYQIRRHPNIVKEQPASAGTTFVRAAAVDGETGGPLQ